MNFAATNLLPVGTKTPGANTAEPLAIPAGTAPSTIPNTAPLRTDGMNKVIVVFKAGTPEEEIKAAEEGVLSSGGQITQRYRSALLGFAAAVPDNQVRLLTLHERIDYVEPDSEVTAYVSSLIRS
ncbi:hypothetical protein BGZ80_010928 [Entomortierella chlamydospora]|uniref:Inhibitor I9 domain-containing protein n=1 Tax=Entomortierella chlamydospora TaxID=101097 RepID=A0A9P6MU05_9FUNG|nr:hypothetical protein BGZ80_010928 [Entomortierella chlamydospora]